jgi:hypothetical protein
LFCGRIVADAQSYRFDRRPLRSIRRMRGLRKRPGEFLSQRSQLGTWSVLQGVLPDTGLRGYRTRSAICLPVCELALSLSFPEVQPRAPAIYNMIGNPIVGFLRRRVGQERNQLTRCKSNSTSKDVACVANFQRRESFLRGQLKNFSIDFVWEAGENLRLQRSESNVFNSLLKILRKIF